MKESNENSRYQYLFPIGFIVIAVSFFLLVLSSGGGEFVSGTIVSLWDFVLQERQAVSIVLLTISLFSLVVGGVGVAKLNAAVFLNCWAVTIITGLAWVFLQI